MPTHTDAPPLMPWGVGTLNVPVTDVKVPYSTEHK